MVRHIVMWSYGDGFTAAENKVNAQKVQEHLERLKTCIPGIAELKVSIQALSSSNMDVVLNSLFESEEALAAYQVHPEHLQASAYVGAVLKDRRCIDYLE